ncbi:MAG: NTP transferase domain-containing protein [Spirochaetota bacterium]
MGVGSLKTVFIQVRLDSARLPRKALLDLGGKTAIEHTMLSLKKVKADVHVLLTDEESREELSLYADKCGFDIFAGPRDDVLKRFVLAAQYYNAGRIIRACGDSPLVSWELAEKIFKRHVEEEADLSGFLGIPLGTGVEVVNTNALVSADRESTDVYEHEHVCPFIYRHPERFRILRPYAFTAGFLREANVTLDTEGDYEYLVQIFTDLYRDKVINFSELVAWLEQNQPSRARQTILM